MRAIRARGLHRQARAAVAFGEGDRGAEGRVPGERKLVDRREDPHPHVSSSGGRQHECRLGQVHLAGDALHALGGEPGGVEEDGDRVALQRRVGEHVGDHVVQHAAHDIGCLRCASNCRVPAIGRPH